jgi:hypothetical protein
MRVPIGSDGWYFCHWSDRPDYAYTEFRGSETLALQWANQLRGDVSAWYSLRGLLGGSFPPLSDEQVAHEVAWRLTSGAWVARRRVVKRVARGGASTPADAAAFPKEERRSASPPSQAPDAPLFPGDIDPEAIAEAQKQAAALGVPFCEECLKAQMAQMAAQ